jgi:hypothetical protein
MTRPLELSPTYCELGQQRDYAGNYRTRSSAPRLGNGHRMMRIEAIGPAGAIQSDRPHARRQPWLEVACAIIVYRCRKLLAL